MKRRVLCIILAALGLPSALFADEAAALRIERKIRDRHMPYLGIIDPVFASADSTEIVSYTRCGDSATWTGHYLAAEAYRYNVTKSPEARTNIMDALNGIRKLVEATGNDMLARCAVPVDSPYASAIVSEESAHGVHVAAIDGIPHFWVGNTSRDQYIGVFFGLTAAFQMVQDQEVHDWVSMLATRMLVALMDRHWQITMPDGTVSSSFIGRPDQQLAMLKLGRRMNPNVFESDYKWRANTYAYAVPAPILVETRDLYNSYFKFNLDYAAMYMLLTSGDSTWIRTHYKNAFDILRKATDDHDNAHFDMVTVAITGRTAQMDERAPRLLDAWLKRSDRDFWTDLHPLYASCNGDDNQSCTVVPVEQRVATDFLWQRSPFQLWGGWLGTTESAGIDYLLPYWMARYHGMMTERLGPSSRPDRRPGRLVSQ
ncbi:MAG TPA: hypothetical protein PKJ41_12825 [Bryobacteraceae bacterium]|nr:hypothetical protein [Bryobacteraceae bacterium]HPT27013.1 hypothetical protein [Bryobacteraceae bacterium]